MEQACCGEGVYKEEEEKTERGRNIEIKSCIHQHMGKGDEIIGKR